MILNYFATPTTMPASARYIGSEDCPGQLAEWLADAIDRAIEPVFVKADGCKHYFDLQS
jgi:hypothetical protein